MDDYHLLNNYLLVGAVLFTLGTVGFLTRRNLIIVLLSAGIMLQGVALTLNGFGTFHGSWSGEICALFVLLATLLEGSVALAVILMFARTEGSLDISLWHSLRDPQVPPPIDEDESLPMADGPQLGCSTQSDPSAQTDDVSESDADPEWTSHHSEEIRPSHERTH